MNDFNTNTDHLIGEVRALRERVRELERAERTRDRAVEALQQTERHLRSLYETMSEGVVAHQLVTDEAGRPVDYRVIEANPAFERQTGVPRADVVGQLASEAYGSGDPPYLEIYAKVVQTGEPAAFEAYFPPLDKHFAISAFRNAEGQFATVFLDITELRRSHQALAESEARFRAIAESAKDSIFIKDTDRRYTFVNPAMEHTLGLSASEILGRTPEEIFDPESAARVTEADLPCLAGESVNLVRTLRLGDRSRTFHTVQVPIKDDSGRVTAVCGIVRDITARERAREAELRSVEQMLQAQKLEALGRLAGGIAHDFNNLLTGVLSNASLARLSLRRGESPEASLDQIERAAVRAAELAKQMLAYSGRGRLEIRVVNLSDLVREIGGLARAGISRRVELRYDLADDLPGVEVDPTQIRQVVLNLITNAAEASDEGGSVVIRTKKLPRSELAGVEWEPGVDGVLLSVEDRGAGMSEDVQRRMFEPFYSTKAAGRGLGLGAVLGIVRGHAGTVRVDSALGSGTTVSVVLPAGPAGVPDTPAPVEERPPEAGRHPVLIVDDEPIVRRAAAATLASHGYEVVVAASCEEACQLAAAHDEPISLVVLDMTMPRLSGLETFERLVQIIPDAAFVLSSGYDRAEATSRFPAGALAGFLPKPYSASQLLNVAQAALGGAR